MILSVAREDGLVIYGSLEGRCAEGTSCALNEEDHLHRTSSLIIPSGYSGYISNIPRIYSEYTAEGISPKYLLVNPNWAMTHPIRRSPDVCAWPDADASKISQVVLPLSTPHCMHVPLAHLINTQSFTHDHENQVRRTSS